MVVSGYNFFVFKLGSGYLKVD